jgi:hypothetical protein
MDLEIKAMQDSLSSGKLLIMEEDLRQIPDAFLSEQVEKRKQSFGMSAQDDRSQREGDIFLEEKKTKEGVVMLPNSL